MNEEERNVVVTAESELIPRHNQMCTVILKMPNIRGKKGPFMARYRESLMLLGVPGFELSGALFVPFTLVEVWGDYSDHDPLGYDLSMVEKED